MENIKNNAWKVGLATTTVLGLLFLSLFINQVKTIFDVDGTVDHAQKNTITIGGKGELAVIPDTATFNFSVTETSKKVADAQAAAAAKINAVIKALTDAGVDGTKDIKTLSYNINPHYEYQGGVCTQSYPNSCRPGTQVLTGYDVSESVQVKVRDISKAGELFSTVGSLNVQNVDSLQFSVDSIDVKKDEAKALAIEDAKTHAETIARALGVHLGRVTGFTDDTSGGNPYPIMYAMDSAVAGKMAAAPQISAGEQKVTSNVSVTYEIR